MRVRRRSRVFIIGLHSSLQRQANDMSLNPRLTSNYPAHSLVKTC